MIHCVEHRKTSGSLNPLPEQTRTRPEDPTINSNPPTNDTSNNNQTTTFRLQRLGQNSTISAKSRVRFSLEFNERERITRRGNR